MRQFSWGRLRGIPRNSKESGGETQKEKLSKKERERERESRKESEEDRFKGPAQPVPQSPQCPSRTPDAHQRWGVRAPVAPWAPLAPPRASQWEDGTAMAQHGCTCASRLRLVTVLMAAYGAQGNSWTPTTSRCISPINPGAHVGARSSRMGTSPGTPGTTPQGSGSSHPLGRSDFPRQQPKSEM